MKIRFVFARNVGPDRKNGFWRWVKANAIGQGIVIWTGVLAVVRLDWKSLKFNFRHVEVWFPDDDGNFAECETVGDGSCKTIPTDEGNTFTITISNYEMKFLGQCFSSTTRGDAEGVRFAPASEVLKHPERWDYIEFEITKESYFNAKWWMDAWVGRKYDFAGLFGFFLPWNSEQAGKFYCSEICSEIAWTLELTKKLHKRISPRRLAKVLGGDVKSLA